MKYEAPVLFPSISCGHNVNKWDIVVAVMDCESFGITGLLRRTRRSESVIKRQARNTSVVLDVEPFHRVLGGRVLSSKDDVRNDHARHQTHTRQLQQYLAAFSRWRDICCYIQFLDVHCVSMVCNELVAVERSSIGLLLTRSCPHSPHPYRLLPAQCLSSDLSLPSFQR